MRIKVDPDKRDWFKEIQFWPNADNSWADVKQQLTGGRVAYWCTFSAEHIEWVTAEFDGESYLSGGGPLSDFLKGQDSFTLRIRRPTANPNDP